MKKATRKTGLTTLRKRLRTAPRKSVSAVVNEPELISDLHSLIQSARQRIASTAYSTQTQLCWHVGRRLLTATLQSSTAAYGKQILVTVSRELTVAYGRGFSYAEIARMIQFAQLFPDENIVVTLSRQLSWSHIHALLPIKEPLAREFYAEMCRIERWDVRTLRKKIGGMLFERTALSRKPKAVVAAGIARLRDGHMSPDLVFRDPYLLDLLGLKGAFSERDLESAILRELEGVLLELGSGFTFIARQKRMSVGKDDFHLDARKISPTGSRRSITLWRRAPGLQRCCGARNSPAKARNRPFLIRIRANTKAEFGSTRDHGEPGLARVTVRPDSLGRSCSYSGGLTTASP